jgi:hypothetical protein
MLRRVLAAAALSSCALLVSACGNQGSTTSGSKASPNVYVYFRYQSGVGAALLVQWIADSSGHLTGTSNESDLGAARGVDYYTHLPLDTLTVGECAVQGVRSGNQVTLNYKCENMKTGKTYDYAQSGTLDPQGLTVQVPQASGGVASFLLAYSTVAAYNQDAALLSEINKGTRAR